VAGCRRGLPTGRLAIPLAVGPMISSATGRGCGWPDIRNGLRQGFAARWALMLTPIFVDIISNYHRELLKEGSYDVDRAYFRVMRIQTIADEVATPLSHLPSGAV
jgi:hypothetical protein